MYLTKNKTERCVMARIQRQGKRYQANFTLKQCGDWKTAMAAAETWVNRLVKNLPPRLTPKGGMTSRNVSGVVGVHRHRQIIVRRRGRTIKKYKFFSWVARWPGCEFHGGVKWPVKSFGQEDAFVLAVLCRRMETTDRDKVLERLAEVRGTPEYDGILDLKQI